LRIRRYCVNVRSVKKRLQVAWFEHILRGSMQQNSTFSYEYFQLFYLCFYYTNANYCGDERAR
jgi:hypothetical protein